MDNAPDTKPSPLKTAATYGLYIGLLVVLCSLIQSVIGLNGPLNILLWLVKTGGTIYLLVAAVKYYRDKVCGGFISFGDAFSFGLQTSFFATLLHVAFAIAMVITSGNAMREQLYTVYAQFVEKGLMQQDMVDTIVDNIGWLMPVITFCWGMFIGCIYSLIMGAALKRNKSIFV